MSIKKTDHDKFPDAVQMIKQLKDLELNDTFIEQLHDMDPPCGWCHSRLDTWLLIKLYVLQKKLLKELLKESYKDAQPVQVEEID
ncbi:MAG: hypothetical protein ACRD5H_00795 [Nitrososphaerales archaeon]